MEDSILEPSSECVLKEPVTKLQIEKFICRDKNYFDKFWITIECCDGAVMNMQIPKKERDNAIEYLKSQFPQADDKMVTEIIDKCIMEDKVNHPDHYCWLKDLCGIEVIDITRHLDFDLGNAIKYILRAGHKQEKGYNDAEKEIEDLQKAIFYINDKIKLLNDNTYKK